ncbi:uncharacterized protein MYCFIDRAFT_196558 [Pseudocercospora fijiensis CIRAD86]|uniref:Uncharacterized protein n=1 Tax=Pseudocercospora fijiensis (strain CIRAD86) TaxID=383855 RepID=M2Z034_PSEFD|nr:uncharacterized protein MYCFIDRAFT_196558 [Pseudocercospora fijiensis CIRAD86]EME83215.1 hypothetical protein MYCFIDRAFT_196558 [Pseudocercospora fijiensis CIRAD86]
MQQGSIRSSSTYSDSSQSASYMEHRNVPSLSSRPTTGSRPTSYAPSHVANIVRKPTPTSSHPQEPGMRRTSHPIDVPGTPARPALTPSTTTDAAPQTPKAALLVLAVGRLHHATLSDLEILLGKQNFSSITIAAGQEHASALKQMKMDIYALIGKLRKETAVFTIINDEWRQSDIEEIIKGVTRNGHAIQGVLCSPEFDDSASECSILNLDDSELESSLKRSLRFLHAISRTTVIHLLSRCKPNGASLNGSFHKTPQGPFFLIAGQEASGPAAQVAKAACDNLILQLAKATSTQRLAVGYTDALLIPEPKKEELSVATNGRDLRTDAYNTTAEDSIFAPGESPSKLWGMWALQEELAS